MTGVWFTVAEAAKVSGLSERTIRRALEKGLIREHRRNAKRSVVSWDDILKWRGLV